MLGVDKERMRQTEGQVKDVIKTHGRLEERVREVESVSSGNSHRLKTVEDWKNDASKELKDFSEFNSDLKGRVLLAEGTLKEKPGKHDVYKISGAVFTVVVGSIAILGVLIAWLTSPSSPSNHTQVSATEQTKVDSATKKTDTPAPTPSNSKTPPAAGSGKNV